jgi:hypothetical protein
MGGTIALQEMVVDFDRERLDALLFGEKVSQNE